MNVGFIGNHIMGGNEPLGEGLCSASAFVVCIIFSRALPMHRAAACKMKILCAILVL